MRKIRRTTEKGGEIKAKTLTKRSETPQKGQEATELTLGRASGRHKPAVKEVPTVKATRGRLSWRKRTASRKPVKKRKLENQVRKHANIVSTEGSGTKGDTKRSQENVQKAP